MRMQDMDAAVKCLELGLGSASFAKAHHIAAVYVSDLGILQPRITVHAQLAVNPSAHAAYQATDMQRDL